MRKKPKFLLAFAVAIITFGSLKAFAPKEFQNYNHCRQSEHCGGKFKNQKPGQHLIHEKETVTNKKADHQG